jgi:undecaprenyl-diphosphatase
MNSLILARLNARDRALFLRWSAAEHASRSTTLLWKTLTHLGGVSCSVAAAVVPLREGGEVASAARHALATLLVSHVIVQLVKRTVGRARPSKVLDCLTLVHEPDRFSFPSGHAAAAMSVAFVYAMAFPSLAGVLIPVALLVGASRICLGVHYPGDVLIGQVIAVLTGIVIVTH